jgi:RNA polymerase sigma-70 factor (ECF subfamily)
MGAATEQLLDRARQGDVEAFAAVFEQFRPLLHRIACRVVGADDGEDVVMDTYLKAWKAIPRFRGDEALRSWLCTATRNCALDYLRRRRREDERLVRDGGDADDETPLMDRVADPRAEGSDRRAERADVGTELADALRQLSADHRTTLLLREVDGLSYKEVAAATGVTIGTVMSRLFYAKYRLRKLLRQKGNRL